MYRAQFRARTQQALTAPRRLEFSMNSVNKMYAAERARRNPYPSYRDQDLARAVEAQNRWHDNLKRIELEELEEVEELHPGGVTTLEKRIKAMINIAEVASDPVNKFSIARVSITALMHLARKWRDRK
jgi:hypothetical protein